MADTFPKLPVPWVVFLVGEALAAGFWLSNLSTRVSSLEAMGSPSAVAALSQLAVIGGRLSSIELTLPQVAANANRLTKVEAEVEALRRDLDHFIDRQPSYVRGEFMPTPVTPPPPSTGR